MSPEFSHDTLISNNARCSDCQRAMVNGESVVMQRLDRACYREAAGPWGKTPRPSYPSNMWWTTCEPCARAWGWDGA